jgi:chaperonin cofactor prefoldin
MSQSDESLSGVVDELEAKADEYDEATNYETTKQKYINSISSVQDALSRLERRIESLEFLVSVLTEIHGEDLPIGGEVEIARQRAESVVDSDIDDFYKLAENESVDKYNQQIQQAIVKINTARDAVKKDLREIEDRWVENVETAKSVQKLVGESRSMMNTLDEIETFVETVMWEESENITTLGSRWDKLMRDWESGDVDWGTFQAEYGLSDETISILKQLANKGEIQFSKLSDDTAKEMLSVDSLRDVLKVRI